MVERAAAWYHKEKGQFRTAGSAAVLLEVTGTLIFRQFAEQFGMVTPWDYVRMLLDISLVAYVVYKLLSLIRGTRAVPLINGIFILVIANLAAQLLRLYTIQFLLQNVFIAASVAVPIIFQPELRRALEHLGRGRLLPTNRSDDLKDEEMHRLVDQMVRAAVILGRTQTGALMVVERETGLGEYIDSGIKVDGLVSSELLTNIFIPNTPLHDGAVIVRGNRVAAAACFLPLAEQAVLAHALGTRHRAGVCITEQTDACSIIVSEETGGISLAVGGMLRQGLDEKTLREQLHLLLQTGKSGPRGFWNRGGA
ncbi:MAG: diadenylate cyclase CdaA [Mycobacterium leprae]